MSLGLNILLIFVFLVIGSVFSGTELALVSLRGSQIEQMEQEDARGAKVAKIARDPNTFLSTVQIGVTLSGFLSASFGASSIAPYLIPAVESWGVHPGIAGGLVNIILTLIISYCSIVISEMVPKRIAMQRTEQIARAVVPAIDAFAAVCRPIIWLIGKNTNGIVRLLGFDPQQTESEVSDDELRVLVSSNTNLSKDERTILDDVFDASETIVAEVMRPRADVVFIEGDQPLAEAAAFVRDQPYSRYPVTGKDFDDVIGFVHVRDLLDVRDPNAKIVRDVVREGISLPGTSKLLPSLELLRKRGIHLAVVIDEYGGTAGLITLEDLLEEIVGEIQDEYDKEEQTVTPLSDGTYRAKASIPLEELNDVLNSHFVCDDVDTLGGFLLDRFGNFPHEGDTLASDGWLFEIASMDGHRINDVMIRRNSSEAGE